MTEEKLGKKHRGTVEKIFDDLAKFENSPQKLKDVIDGYFRML